MMRKTPTLAAKLQPSLKNISPPGADMLIRLELLARPVEKSRARV